MAELVADCPRCGSSRITFDLTAQWVIRVEHGWQQWYEAFCICRRCNRATIFVLSENANYYKYVHDVGLQKVSGAVNGYVTMEGFINVKDMNKVEPPEHIPENIKSVFEEGATCRASGA